MSPHLVLVIFAFIAFGAMMWMVLASFKSASEIIAKPPTFLPEAPTFGSYALILREQAFGRFFINSIVVALPSVLLILFSSSIAGFVFAKFDFPAKEVIFTIILSTLMVPPAVTLLPLFRLVSRLGWADTYQALIIPVCVSAFGIFLLRQFMEGLPFRTPRRRPHRPALPTGGSTATSSCRSRSPPSARSPSSAFSPTGTPTSGPW